MTSSHRVNTDIRVVRVEFNILFRMEGWGFNHCQNYTGSAHKNRGLARLDKRPARVLAEPASYRSTLNVPQCNHVMKHT